ncbi:MAG: hypothetical protein QGG36_29695 [Pirellulaceae bacterium]|jgi:hypothetical protein|nr:hypothetical protein [Pirellulaceae bacterium]MDP7020009.1 hypothetical protein [Pirellulaceae bacterium]
MPFEKQYDTPEPIEHPPCLHLRSKAMFVTGDRSPTHADEEGGHYCWCNETQHIIGPDDKDVGRRACDPVRNCYKETL